MFFRARHFIGELISIGCGNPVSYISNWMMYVFIAFTGILVLFYSLLILYYHWAWERIPVSPVHPAADQPVASRFPFPVKVSVIIPARNEEEQIDRCLESILNQSYPADLTEVIVVNDFSTDETASRVARFQKVRLLNLSDGVGENGLNAYKKKAIETGIAAASGELIICTDADCTADPEWIVTMVQAYQNGSDMIAGPVKITTDHSALSVFQALDFISLQGITGAAVYKNLYPMCNGANLAYRREAFHAVQGFRDIDHIASGDDMLLMRKMQMQFPGKTVYLKNLKAIVSTGPAANLSSFFHQRIRWASKISHYKHPATFITLALVYALNLCLLLLFGFSFFYPTWHWLILLLVLKTFAEFFFVSGVANFFDQRPLMKYFIFCQPFHIIYTVIAGTFGLFGKYKWKGRVVK
jgi:cellulose synthase/poly-beta-1,6-N-acetylglucosamine synthase-like glycosyltransferase